MEEWDMVVLDEEPVMDVLRPEEALCTLLSWWLFDLRKRVSRDLLSLRRLEQPEILEPGFGRHETTEQGFRRLIVGWYLGVFGTQEVE